MRDWDWTLIVWWALFIIFCVLGVMVIIGYAVTAGSPKP